MSEEKKPKTLSRAETWKRITHLSLGAPFDSAQHHLLNECIQLQRAEQKAEDEQSDRHRTAVALEKLAQDQGALRQDFADVGDTMCEIVGKERIPPEPKDVDETSRRNLYVLVKGITAKRGNLDTFLNKATWTFRGFTVREIYKDADGLRKFINTERMAISREEHTDI